MRWSLRPSRHGDVVRIAKNMREIDRRECEAMGVRPKAALHISRKASTWSLTALYDGEPVAMFGVTGQSVVDGVGSPWMLATDGAKLGAKAVALMGPDLVQAMHDDWPHLWNRVAAENRIAIRLLEYLGFTVEPDVVHIGGLAMRNFRRSADVR